MKLLLAAILILIAPPVFAAELPSYQEEWGLKKSVYAAANNYLKANRFKNSNFATVIDFSQHSSKRRLYLFDLKSGKVSRHNVAHGKNSDANGDGMADSFSNLPDSRQSSLGAYVTAELYTGSHGLSMRLDGQQATNSKARKRAIVVHSASYVKDGVRAGRSWGCPAIDPAIYQDFMSKTKGGSLLFIGR